MGQSVLADSPFASRIRDGIDPSSLSGSAEPYEIPNLRLELVTPTDLAVPVQWWRSVGHTHTAFVMEHTIDQLARRAKKDPVEYRRDHHPGDRRDHDGYCRYRSRYRRLVRKDNH